MISEQTIVAVERLGGDLGHLKRRIREHVARASGQVRSTEVRALARELADKWLTDLSVRPEVANTIDSDYLADLNVHFQRLLTFSERAVLRSRYETEIRSILRDFTLNVTVPLKRARLSRPANAAPRPAAPPEAFVPTAFVGHSFASEDKAVVETVIDTLKMLGLSVVTGEKPAAMRISEKVKRLIDEQHLFVGLFTRRDKITRRSAWTTSAWVLDEKAYAFGKGKKLILLKEEGVDSIGGLQGDYEFIEFGRSRMDIPVRKLLQLFELTLAGLKP